MGKVLFQSKGIYVGFVLFWILRLIVTFSLGTYYFCVLGCNYNPPMRATEHREEGDDVGEDGKGGSDAHQQIRSKGLYMYGSMFPLFYGGFYRVMPSDCFAWELGCGYAMELFVGLIPSLFFMVSTNAEADTQLLGIASAAVIIKVLSLLIFMCELSVMVCEIYKIRTL